MAIGQVTEAYDPATYWEHRYSSGDHSGAGSRGAHAMTKAAALNEFVGQHQVTSIVDWGCGDGYLTELLDLDGVDYCGVDISRTAVGLGLLRWDHQYIKWNPMSRADITVRAELALSVDVIFHLTSDGMYRRYMGQVFESATRFVVVYAPSKNGTAEDAAHVRYREWLGDVPPAWSLIGDPADEAGPWCFAT